MKKQTRLALAAEMHQFWIPTSYKPSLQTQKNLNFANYTDLLLNSLNKENNTESSKTQEKGSNCRFHQKLQSMQQNPDRWFLLSLITLVSIPKHFTPPIETDPKSESHLGYIPIQKRIESDNKLRSTPPKTRKNTKQSCSDTKTTSLTTRRFQNSALCDICDTASFKPHLTKSREGEKPPFKSPN